VSKRRRTNGQLVAAARVSCEGGLNLEDGFVGRSCLPGVAFAAFELIHINNLRAALQTGSGQPLRLWREQTLGSEARDRRRAVNV